jgi:hypothetical protein
MIKLEINGKNVDLSKQLIAITRQVINAENPSVRLLDITNRFALPKTQNNKQILNSAHILNSDNNYMDIVYNAKMIDQSPIFSGIGFINSYDKDTYNFQLVDASKELFDNLKNKINKLNFDDQDIVFSFTEYKNIKFDNEGLWIWPIVSMHEESTITKTPIPVQSNTDLQYIRPFFRLKYILDKLITNQNWTYTNDTNLLDNLCISSNHDSFFITSYQKTLTQDFSSPSNENINDLLNYKWNKGNILTDTTINQGGIKTKYRLRGNIITDSDVIIIIKGTETVTSKEIKQEFTINSNQSEINFISKEFYSNSNDIIIEFLIISQGNFKFDNVLLYTLIEENNFGDLSTNPLVNYGIKAYDNLPDISQIDILKLVSILTNSIWIPDSFNKVLNIKTLANLDKLNSIDWSDKFDQQSEFVENKLEKYGQTNELLYDNDDTIPSDLGKETFEIFNQSLEDVKEYITIPFAASNDIRLSIYNLATMNIYNDTERINELNPRILYYYNNSEPPSYTLARFSELDWRTLKENYYKNWFLSLYRTRKIEGLADLKKLDVLGFDFTKLVYIDYFKAYFFVLIMEDYVPGQKTKVELLKFL